MGWLVHNLPHQLIDGNVVDGVFNVVGFNGFGVVSGKGNVNHKMRADGLFFFKTAVVAVKSHTGDQYCHLKKELVLLLG